MAPTFGIALCLLLQIPSDLPENDTVYLTDGKEKQGRVVYEDDTVVVLRRGSREERIPSFEIKDIDSRQRSMDELLDRLEALGSFLGTDDVPTLVELARFSQNARLPNEARLLYLRTLLSDPDNVEANEALGNRKRSKGWSIKHPRSWNLTKDLRTIVEDWKERWELSTTHFRLDTNLPLDQAVAAAIDLERFYRAFYDLFAAELSLLEPHEILMVRIHADEKSFPEPGDGRPVFFDRDDLSVAVSATRPGWRAFLFNEVTKQLLFFVSQRTRDARGLIPEWLSVGLGEALSTGLGGELGNSTFDLESSAATHFNEHARADKPYELGRVLVFEPTDFLASVKRELKYAQSYTLLHFLLYGDGGAWRERLMDFLRSALEGRSSATDFKDILDIDDEDDLEDAWFAYVKDVARRL